MKKIVLFSDVHYATGYLNAMIEDNMDADYYFFMGDGIDRVMSHFPDEIKGKLFAVEGNCDAMYQSDRLETIEGKRILLTHGNKYRVKSGLLTISYHAEEIGADIVCYGHTHRRDDTESRGVRYINPGALMNGEYALLIIENGEVFVVPQTVKK